MAEKKFSLIAVLKADTAQFKKGMNNGGKSLNSFLLKATGAFAAFKGAVNLKDMVLDAVNLAGKTQGVAQAFAQLNDPNLLSNLRRATKNTVADLKLMTMAVQAKNLGIPVKELSTYFEFATLRASQTGESVDELVEKIVLGIGRQSVLRLDDLGLSAVELNAKFKETGNFAEAAGQIIQRELAAAGDVMKTDAQRAQELNASLENQKAILGQKLLPLYSAFLKGVNNVIGGVSSEITTLKQQKEQINLTLLSITSLKEGTDERTRAINQLKKAYPAYFGNLDAEKTKNEDLSKIVRQVNEDYANRIVIAEYEKELGKVFKAEEKLERKRVSHTEALRAFYDYVNPSQTKVFVEFEKLKSEAERVLAEAEKGNYGFIAKGYLVGMQKTIDFFNEYDENVNNITNEKAGIEAAKNSLLQLLSTSKEIEEIDPTGSQVRIGNLDKLTLKTKEYTAEQEALLALFREQSNLDFSKGIVGPEALTITKREPGSLGPTDDEISAWQQIGLEITSANTATDILMSGIVGLQNAFINLFSEQEAGFKDVLTAMLQTSLQVINILLAQAIAGVIADGAKKNGLIGALLAGSLGLTALIGLWNSKVPNFADGGIFSTSGIVPGTSYTGDRVNAHLNSGEMVLNGAQQRNLMRLINGSASQNKGLTGRLTIEGTKLVALIETVVNQQNSIR